MNTFAKIAAATLTLLACACNPYNPDLGDTPFLCDPPDPENPDKQRCPDGYDPVDVGPPHVCECHVSEGGGNGADAGNGGGDGGFVCTDVNEGGGGNENIATATPTAIGPMAMTSVFNDLAICPTTDVDTFSMNITQAGMMVEVRVQFPEANGLLALRILNSSGTMIATGTLQTDQLRATATVPASGTYYAQVSAGEGGAQNGYDIQMIVSGP